MAGILRMFDIRLFRNVSIFLTRENIFLKLNKLTIFVKIKFKNATRIKDNFSKIRDRVYLKIKTMAGIPRMFKYILF